jgi:hypothetical protein
MNAWETGMTMGEEAYLALVVVSTLAFMVVLFWASRGA